MKKSTRFIYILLLVLTFATLIALAVWSFTKHNAALYVMIALFVSFMIVFLITLIIGKAEKKTENDPNTKEFLLLAESEQVKSVFLSAYCTEKQIRKPRSNKKDFYVALFSTPNADFIKERFTSSEEAVPDFLGTYDIPFRALSALKGKTVILDGQFLELLKDCPLYEQLLSENEIYPYGSEQGE